MKELVIISGKGGTGKTSMTAAFGLLAERPVLADCDVDAADLHLVLAPEVEERHPFHSGHEAVVRPDDCIACGICMELCRFGAISGPDDAQADAVYTVDPIACEGCGVCVRFCPVEAIDFPQRHCGEWMISRCRTGPMVHAALGIAAENSGKLVATVRAEARRIAEEGGHPLVLVDGPPGIGCPVIASVAGASSVLVVTEPSVSGAHDLERVVSLTQHFEIPAAVCVNKWDLNPQMTKRIEDRARQLGARVVGRVRYNSAVTQAQMQARAVIELDTKDAKDVAQDVRQIWEAWAT